jgi:NAD(P)-dependent dehydrogenase (short-subunit alcohol dehydrogenase family)
MTLQPPLSDLIDLTGRTAVVTGGAIGIGLGVARRLAEAGASVLVADLDGEAASATAKQLRESGGRAMAMTTDVSDEQSVSVMERRLNTSPAAASRADIGLASGDFARLGETDVFSVPHTQARGRPGQALRASAAGAAPPWGTAVTLDVAGEKMMTCRPRHRNPRRAPGWMATDDDVVRVAADRAD